MIDARCFDPEANRTWLRKRKGLGASDIPALSGTSRFSDRQKVYDRLVALHDHGVLLDEEIGPDQQRGMLLEHVAVELYEQQTQRKTREAGNTIHAGLPWLSATPDRFAPVDRTQPFEDQQGMERAAALVEIKVVRSWVLDRLLQAGLPEPSHVEQCQMQMLITGTHDCHLFYWSPESMKTLLFPLEYDLDEGGRLLGLAEDFWEDNFRPRVRPGADLYDEGPVNLSAAMVRLEDASLEAKCHVYTRLKEGSKAASGITGKVKDMILAEGQQHATSKLQVGGYEISMPWVATKKQDNGALDAFLMEHGKRLADFKVPSGGHYRLSVKGEPSAAIRELTDEQLNQLVESTEGATDEDN